MDVGVVGRFDVAVRHQVARAGKNESERYRRQDEFGFFIDWHDELGLLKCVAVTTLRCKCSGRYTSAPTYSNQFDGIYTMSEKKSTRGEVRRQALIAVATELFLEKGFGAASVNEIVRRAGGSLATLYSMFDSKEALFEAVLLGVNIQVLEPLQRPAAFEQPVREVLFSVGQGYISALRDPKSLALLRLFIAEGSKFPALREMAARSAFAQGDVLFRRYLQQQTEAGVLSIPDVALAASQFKGLLRGNWHIPAAIGLDVPQTAIDAALTGAVDMFLQVYLPNS
jgi:AcrR family transcriptional regulator